MPGVLKRSHDRMVADSTTADGHLAAFDGSRKRQATEMANGDGRTNGILSLTNGVHANETSQSHIAAAGRLDAFAEAASSEVPPEIEHISVGFIPLRQVIERFNQNTFTEFEAVINQMADLSTSQPNGHGSALSAHANVQKKQRLWDFAQERRSRYIKLMVLAQWSRQSEAVSKLIDLNHWMMKQKALYRESVSWVGELKRLTSSMKLPAPDLRSALDVLSKGKADWLTDLGFIPPTPLSPKELLIALQTINTLLTVRINTHETIPHEMSDYSVASGRITFHVKDEFELDLSIADEDPSSQLFFIDIRFAFSPCVSEIPEGPLRNDIEGRINHMLRKEQLKGCYEFLHDFVLTHKVNLLKHQAYDMLRSRWAENIRIEPAHRGFVVQYWLHRPGPKSWIELGIKKSRRKGDETPDPHLFLRWHRHGKEILDHGVEIDISELSLETMLKEIIAKHTNYIFKATKRKLMKGAIYKNKVLLLKHRAGWVDSTDCSLKVQVTHPTIVTILQEPISGAFSLAPPSRLHNQVERDLNSLRDPASDAHSRIGSLRGISATEQVMAITRNISWLPVRTITPNAETVKKYFDAEGIRPTFFRISMWGFYWMLALTTSIDGDRWWVVETREVPAHPTPEQIASGEYQAIKKSLEVFLEGDKQPVFAPSYASLTTIEKAAAAIISQNLDVVYLGGMRILHHQVPPREPPPRYKVPELLMNIRNRTTTGPKVSKWSTEPIKCTFIGLTRARDAVINQVSGRLMKANPDLSLVSKSNCGLTFNETSGQFSFRLQTPIGEVSIPTVFGILDQIANLIHYVRIVRSRRLSITNLSLSNLSFHYEDSSLFDAALCFEPGVPMKISFRTGDPHIRIADFLRQSLNEPTQGLNEVCATLNMTLGILHGFDYIEKMAATHSTMVEILPRSRNSFRVSYENLHFRLAYDIRIRKKGDQALWYIGAPQILHLADRNFITSSKSSVSTTNFKPDPKNPTTTNSKPDPKDGKDKDIKPKEMEIITTVAAAVKSSWSELTSETGIGWEGIGRSLTSEASGVESCVKRVDEVLRQVMTNVVITHETAQANSSGVTTKETEPSKTTAAPVANLKGAQPSGPTEAGPPATVTTKAGPTTVTQKPAVGAKPGVPRPSVSKPAMGKQNHQKPAPPTHAQQGKNSMGKQPQKKNEVVDLT